MENARLDALRLALARLGSDRHRHRKHQDPGEQGCRRPGAMGQLVDPRGTLVPPPPADLSRNT
jgi:hypothetical protein